MTGIGGSKAMGPSLGSAAPVSASVSSSWGRKIDDFFDQVVDGLMKCLCRASRGYLCPPDMHRVMFPDESQGAVSRAKGCCDEDISLK